MNFGFDGELAQVTLVAAALTKIVLYPLVQLRRRVEVDGRLVPRGSPYLHPGLQGPVVCLCLCILAVVFCALTNAPLFPVLAAVVSGYAGARVAHEGGKVVATSK
jgi:uncharacterized membrane protein